MPAAMLPIDIPAAMPAIVPATLPTKYASSWPKTGPMLGMSTHGLKGFSVSTNESIADLQRHGRFAPPFFSIDFTLDLQGTPRPAYRASRKARIAFHTLRRRRWAAIGVRLLINPESHEPIDH